MTDAKAKHIASVKLGILLVVSLAGVILTLHFRFDRDLVSIVGSSLLTAICDRGCELFFGGAL